MTKLIPENAKIEIEFKNGFSNTLNCIVKTKSELYQTNENGIILKMQEIQHIACFIEYGSYYFPRVRTSLLKYKNLCDFVAENETVISNYYSTMINPDFIIIPFSNEKDVVDFCNSFKKPKTWAFKIL